MNTLPTPHTSETKKSILPAFTQKAKFEKFCSEAKELQDEIYRILIENNSDDANRNQEITEILKKIVYSFVKNTSFNTHWDYWNRTSEFFYLPKEIRDNYVKWQSEMHYNLNSFADVLSLVKSLKNLFWFNEKKNKWVYEKIIYNKNVSKYLQLIATTDIRKFYEQIKEEVIFCPIYDIVEINKDISSYPYEIKLIYEITIVKDKIQIVQFNSFYYFYFDNITPEIIEFFNNFNNLWWE